MIITIKKLFGEGLINLRILSLKELGHFDFQRLGSKMFHSRIIVGKKEFLKKLCVMLKKMNVANFFCSICIGLSGIRLKWCCRLSFFVHFVKYS